MNIQISDFVRVKDQTISGQVIELHGSKVVIIDDTSEYEYPENCLEYHLSDLEPA